MDDFDYYIITAYFFTILVFMLYACKQLKQIRLVLSELIPLPPSGADVQIFLPDGVTPAVGANVLITDENSNVIDGGSGVTDVEGKFSINCNLGNYNLTVTDSNGDSATQAFTVTSGVRAIVTVTLTRIIGESKVTT